MTKEESIEELSVIWERLSHPEECENGCYSFRDGDYLEALDMAIKALSEPSGDLISRADAMAEFREWVKMANENGETPTWNDAVSLIGSLPSAEAKTKCIARINVDTEEVVTRIKEEYDKVLNGYMEWLEKIIVEAETFEWLCEDNTDEEWCLKNCNYASIQAKCLRHIYEVSKGGADE